MTSIIQNMTKKIFVAGIISFFLLSMAVPVMAQYGLQDAGSKAGYQDSDVYAFSGKVINMALSMLAVLFMGVMLYAGIRWMTSRGNEEYSKKAKTALEAGIIGLIIIIMAYAISTFVLDQLKVSGPQKSTDLIDVQFK